MSFLTLELQQFRHTVAVFGRAGWPLLALAVVLMAAALVIPAMLPATLLTAAAGTLTALVVLVRLFGGAGASAQEIATLADNFARFDHAAGFATDPDGAVVWRNPAAARLHEGAPGETLVVALSALFADPAPVVRRLWSMTQAQGAAQEDVISTRGPLRISAHRLSPQHIYWRLDELGNAPGDLLGSATVPHLSFGPHGNLLSMNVAARGLLGSSIAALDDIIPGGPVRNGTVVSLSGVQGPLNLRLAQIDRPGGGCDVYLLPAGAVPDTAGFNEGFFDALPVALLKLTPTGRVAMANRLARDLLGSPTDAAQLGDLVEGLGRSVLDWLREVADGRILQRAEVMRVRRDDKEVFLQITLSRVMENDQPALVAVLHDATELKTLEAQFVQSQKMQAIGQLAGGVAHDFNNLLTAITGHCDLLLLRHDQSDPDFGDLMQINQNANRAASLVGQLLAFSRKQTLRPEVVDLRDALADLTHLLNRLVGERVTLTVSHDPDLPHIRADKRQLEQVIMNLVVNARDAMPAGGEIRIETATHRLTSELRRDRAIVPPGSYVLVRVIDEGAGIAPDKLTKIFEPFFTTKRVGEGTGLGLSTAYGIVKQSGGFIFVDSIPGEGSCFTLYFPEHRVELPVQPEVAVPIHLQPEADEFQMLPASVPASAAVFRRAADGSSPRVLRQDEAVVAGAPRTGGPLPVESRITFQAPAGQAPVIPARPRAGGPRQMSPGNDPSEGVILLVEDEAPVRAFASRALRMRGYTVLEADSAEQALETLRDRNIMVDVFVTDVVMPGMDGPEWVRRALRDRPQTKVVFVSGYAQDSFADTQMQIPNSVFLPKPFSLTELTTTIRDQLA